MATIGTTVHVPRLAKDDLAASGFRLGTFRRYCGQVSVPSFRSLLTRPRLSNDLIGTGQNSPEST
ncbi:hypothetical protein P152DRAFT_459342 [Eremomyces bilateralis CBS 781.70]|uniref:Uncharacterized protein n=1 Tax=Eremomyces bilateralis CBS 781.70 TaxID=1392243 RepID=A0A6G1G0F4_9PEZI|nr:uncharacterized protein P152DRAFT_459342 [Eremomyces bilateralis CBS 781.70]KAF1811406.1 hypothetical protein P152DRAFT_459342 [Eremomyces bilateralis CBS 781.70]